MLYKCFKSLTYDWTKTHTANQINRVRDKSIEKIYAGWYIKSFISTVKVLSFKT